MSIDPRLGGLPHPSQYRDPAQTVPPHGNVPTPPAPPSSAFGGTRTDNLRAEGGGYTSSAQQSPHPYYHYPTPQTHTPQQHNPASTGSYSNQASPEQHPHYQHISNDGDASPEQGGDGLNGDDAKRPRACEACRGLKVRCDQDPMHPEIPCKRCAKAGRQCLITQPSRKRQKKADGRVAELEKKLDALTAALQQQQQQAYAPPPMPGASAPAADMMGQRGSVGSMQQYGGQTMDGSPAAARTPVVDPSMHSNKRRRTEEEPQMSVPYDNVDVAINPALARSGSTAATKTEEQIGRGFKDIQSAWATTPDLKRYLYRTTPEEFVGRIDALISPEVATTIFDRYTTKLVSHLPAVVFPPGTTADQVYRDKPILYVCILSAASFGTLHPDISKKLAREAIGAIADCVVRNGAKSLELIQAMQVMALWYKPPEQAEQTNFYQIIHMAAIMALDIGLGKRFNPAKARRGFGGPNAQYVPGPHKALPQDSDTPEARRAWLTCYYLCASASMVLRRPNLVRWTNYMKECIEVLETHPDAYPSDKLFCQYVKIQHICEDIGLQFLMDDNTATISITDPKVTYALNVLENQLKDWKEQIPAECRGQGLQFFEHVTSLYLHEIALHFNHNIEDFRLPFTEESLKSVNNTSDTLSQNQMAALEACLKAAHGILDTMLSYEKSTVKSLPMLLFFVRCVYAIVILIKMHVAVCTPNSELGKMMQPEDLRVDYYLDRLIGLFAYVANDAEDTRPHPKILRILHVLKEWFNHHKENVSAQARGDVVQPPQDHHQQQQQQTQQQPPPHRKGIVKAGADQTPLHLLSHVATNNQGRNQPADSRPEANTDWTFTSPSVIDHSKAPARGHPDNRYPFHDPHQNQYAGMSTQVDPQQQGMLGSVDPMNQDYGWGSGFEQAMDIALGGMDGLQGGGLDNWFLGDGMAPFGFNGDVGAAGGQW